MKGEREILELEGIVNEMKNLQDVLNRRFDRTMKTICNPREGKYEEKGAESYEDVKHTDKNIIVLVEEGRRRKTQRNNDGNFPNPFINFNPLIRRPSEFKLLLQCES